MAADFCRRLFVTFGLIYFSHSEALQLASFGSETVVRLMSSSESRIIFLPERSSICQYRPEISAIIVKTQSRACLVLAHPVLHIAKTQKNVLYKDFENNHFKINQKALWATFGNLHNLRKWVRQSNLS